MVVTLISQHNLLHVSIIECVGAKILCCRIETKKVGGEWSFKKSGSRKILAEFRGSRSLVFSADLRYRSLDFFRNVQKSQMSRSRNLKSGKVSVSQRKTLVSPSHKVSILPFATPRKLCNRIVVKFACC